MDSDHLITYAKFGAALFGGTFVLYTASVVSDQYKEFMAEATSRFEKIDSVDNLARDVEVLNKYTNDTVPVHNIMQKAGSIRQQLVFNAEDNSLWVHNTADILFNIELDSYSQTVRLAGKTALKNVIRSPGLKNALRSLDTNQFDEPKSLEFDSRFSRRSNQLPNVLLPRSSTDMSSWAAQKPNSIPLKTRTPAHQNSIPLPRIPR